MVPNYDLQVKHFVALLLVLAFCFLLFPLEFYKRGQTRAEKDWNRSLLLPAKHPCTCYLGSEMLSDHIAKDDYEALAKRRSQEYQKHKVRTASILSKPLVAPANSPLQYPISGYTVQPLTPTPIPGLGLSVQRRSSYQVTLKVSIGVLTSEVYNAEVTVKGSGSSELTLKSKSLMVLNLQLAKVFYTSTIYHVNTGDLASLRFEDYEAVFPIKIKELVMPLLWDTGKDINSLVTIATKTFMRYERLSILLKSIREFYPKISIIIADDSFQREELNGKNIHQYFMPPGKGWFAGRNMAVSQVTTKYFLWVDDDYEFTRKTKIEKFVEVMEAHPHLDVVAGTVQGYEFSFNIEHEEGDDSEGGCLHLNFDEKYQPLMGYPQCFIVNGAINFFLARTDAIRKADFDPKFDRLGHQEFFMDGLGSLNVAMCEDYISMHVNHQPHRLNTRWYLMFRYNKRYNSEYRYPIFFFKHNLKCLKFR